MNFNISACSTRGTMDGIGNWFNKQLKPQSMAFAIGEGPYKTIMEESSVRVEGSSGTLVFRASLTSEGTTDDKGIPLKAKTLTGELLMTILIAQADLTGVKLC